MKRALVVMEMQGTWNALRRSLINFLKNTFKWDLRYVASDAALNELTKVGIECCAQVKDDPAAVIADQHPDIVITGISAFTPAHPKWTGLELKYALAAMDAGIPVVMYRDYTGIANWVEEVSRHPKAKELLHYFVFDEATAKVFERKNWAYRSLRVVGSGYYDELYNVGKQERDFKIREAKQKLGIAKDDRVLLLNAGAKADRVLEMLVPVVDALEKYGNDKIVFIPTFHPKDPNAPFVDNRDKTYTAKRSEVYDPVLDRLNGKVRMIREPKAREALPNSQDRIRLADFIVMNPLSTETWTAAFYFKPMVFVLTPKVIEECQANNINPADFDLVHLGAADAVYSEAELYATIADWCSKGPKPYAFDVKSLSAGFSPEELPKVSRGPFYRWLNG